MEESQVKEQGALFLAQQNVKYERRFFMLSHYFI
jgi:hypothetical protein